MRPVFPSSVPTAESSAHYSQSGPHLTATRLARCRTHSNMREMRGQISHATPHPIRRKNAAGGCFHLECVMLYLKDARAIAESAQVPTLRRPVFVSHQAGCEPCSSAYSNHSIAL